MIYEALPGGCRHIFRRDGHTILQSKANAEFKFTYKGQTWTCPLYDPFIDDPFIDIIIIDHGPVMAKRITKKFGKETLSVIENEPDTLIEVAGIGKKHIKMVKDAWQEQNEIRKVMLFREI